MNTCYKRWISILLFLSLQAVASAQLSGTYTIGDSTCTFQSVQDAITTLRLSGTAGNVFFLIKPGHYQGFSLPAYQPSHPTDTAFFQSESLVANDVTIQGMIRVSNSSGIRFRYLRFEPFSGQQSSCVGVSGPGSAYFGQCVFFNPYSTCFTSQEALFSANCPFSGPYGNTTLEGCLLSSLAYTIFLSGGNRGSVRFLNDTINGAIDCFNSGFSVNYTGNVFNLTNPSFDFTGQTFRGNTFNGSDLRIQGNFFFNTFYCSVHIWAGKICNNHFFNAFTAAHNPGVLISNNIFEGKFDLIYSSNAIVARNRFHGEATFTSDYSCITGNFFYAFASCTQGPGYQVKHNNFHPDAGFEMYYTSGTVEDNNFGSMFIQQYGITRIFNNNFIPGGGTSVNIYGTDAHFYDPGYVSADDLHATNPALIRKSAPGDGTPGMLYDIDSTLRKPIPTIGANEICFSFQCDTINLECDNVCLDLCTDTLSGVYWSPSYLFADSSLLAPVIRPGVSCMAYLNKAGTGTIDSVFLHVSSSFPQAIGTAVVTDHLVHFTNMSVCADSIRWDLGDGTSSTANNVYHSFPVYGMYRCKLIAFSSLGNDTLLLPQFLTCLPGGVMVLCNDSLRVESCIGDFTGYYWSPSYLFPDSTRANPLIFPTANDVIYLHNVNWPEVVTMFVNVYPAVPSASLTYSIDSLSVSFSNKTVCADSIRWDFGDGTSSTAPDPVHTYPAYGIYKGKLFAFSLAGSDTAQFTLEITGIGSAGKTRFEIWPNPASGYLVVDPEAQITRYSIRVNDLYGRAVYQAAGIQHRKRIDLTGFSPGLYTVMVQSTRYSLVRKIIVR